MTSGAATARIVGLGVVLCGALLLVPSYAQTDSDFDKGMAEFRSGNYASAVSFLERGEGNSPGKTVALLYEAKALVHLENFMAAEDALRRYLATHADSSDALYMLGFVLNRQNRAAESLRTYTQAAALSPPTGDDLKIVGLDYVLLDDYADAVKWLEKAVEGDARNADAWYYLGRAYYTKARRDDARRAFLTVLEIDPRNVKAKNNLGLILETDGQTAAALEAYRTAIAWQEESPHRSEQPYVNLGNLLMEQGQTKEALSSLQRAVAIAPNNPYCRMTLGMAYRHLDQLQDAQRELEKATQLEPENAKAHYQLGRLYKDLHQFDRAQAEFKKTADLQAQASGAAATQSNH